MRREVGEDLHQLIEVDQDVLGVHENAPSDEGDGGGRKKKKKDKGKEKEKERPKTKDDKEKEDQEFLMKFALLELSCLTQKLMFPLQLHPEPGVDRSECKKAPNIH